MSIWQEFENWIATLFHHAKAGTLPPASTVISGPVSVTPAPAAATPSPAVPTAAPAVASPIAAPAPVAPIVAPSPAPIVDSYPAIDADGCIKPAEFIGTPIASYRCMIQDTYSQPNVSSAVKDNLARNFDDNFGMRIQDNSSDPLNVTDVTEGHNYLVPRMQPSNNAPSYGDVLVFPDKNPAANYPGFRLVDCAAFVARCQASGKWPKIDHTSTGVVA